MTLNRNIYQYQEERNRINGSYVSTYIYIIVPFYLNHFKNS